jgi:hypothetical protein
MKKIQFIIIQTIFISSLHAQFMGTFSTENTPNAPDYSITSHWIALPFQNDAADEIPYGEVWIHDSLKKVDVFYIYPTLYLKGKNWNADLDDEDLNKKIASYPVKFQATCFNEVGRVYVPLYRQAIIHSFYDHSTNGLQALNFAYEDVKKAFEYYLENYNNGRPIIIASHSQGTWHARRLLKDFFDNTEMKKQLVCAYTIGFGMYQRDYEVLKPCDEPKETGCYVNWASFKKGGIPPEDSKLIGDVCVNPVTWKRDTTEAISNGGLLLSLQRRKGFRSRIQIHDRYLWVSTSMPFVQNWRVMHKVDYNLFWHDIRNNVKERVEAYLSK